MNFSGYKQLSYLPTFLLILIAAIYGSCKFKTIDRKNVSFKKVIGIHYTEVRRRLWTGRSFDSQGYEVNPQWKMFFMPKDSASVFSPDSNRFLTFPVMADHDSLFYVGNSWFRAKKVTKDSMVFQVMKVETRIIYLLHSNLYMTLYADDYIKKMKSDLATLQKPDHLDTVYVRERAMLADKYPDTVFAARIPVVLKSRSPLVKVEKEEITANLMNRFNTSDSYLDPIYDITINKAYQDFYHSFKVRIDNKGQMSFVKDLTFADDADTDIRIIKGIIDGYLKLYVQAIPGNTLGIIHASIITLNVQGRK